MADMNLVPALDVFKAYLGQFFTNVDQELPWINALYNSSQKYYAMGMTDDAVANVVLSDKDAPQEFKDRFAGIFALKDLKAKNPGAVVHIPSIAEYANLQEEMSKELKARGLNDLATNDNLNKIIGGNIDFSQFQARLNDAFDAVDNADQFLRKELESNFPSLKRSDLAQALLMGTEGADALKKKIGAAGMRAAASEFGLQTQTTGEQLYSMEQQGMISRQTARAGYKQSAAELTGVTEAAKKFGTSTKNIQSELEKENVIGTGSAEVKRLRSQARAEFQGATGASSTALRRKRQV